MTALNLHIVNNPPLDVCAICLENLGNGKTVLAHEGASGALHPLHRNCFETYLKYVKNCPICKAKVNAESIPYSLKERVVGASLSVSYNAIVANLVGNTLFNLTNSAVQVLRESVPIIANVAINAISNEIAVLALGVSGSFMGGALLTGGVVVGTIAVARAIGPMINEMQGPVSELDADALAVALISGTIISAVSSPAAGAIGSGLIAGFFSSYNRL